MVDLVKSFILDVWELRRVRLYDDNPSVQQTQSQIASGELQGVAGGRGELRCLEVRQTPHVHIFYVPLLTVPPIALGAWSMALVLWKPPEFYYVLAKNVKLLKPLLEGGGCRVVGHMYDKERCTEM